jgi:hypothetical protein
VTIRIHSDNTVTIRWVRLVFRIGMGVDQVGI